MVYVRHSAVGDEVPRGEHSFGGWRSACSSSAMSGGRGAINQRRRRLSAMNLAGPIVTARLRDHRPLDGQGRAWQGCMCPWVTTAATCRCRLSFPPDRYTRHHRSPVLVRQPTTSDGPRGRSLSADLCTIGRYRRTNIPTDRQTQRNADRDTSLVSCIGEVGACKTHKPEVFCALKPR